MRERVRKKGRNVPFLLVFYEMAYAAFLRKRSITNKKGWWKTTSLLHEALAEGQSD